MTGKASNGAFVTLDLGQLRWSVLDCAVTDMSRNAELNLFSFHFKKKKKSLDR